jgi:hypothetical protein
MNNETHLIFEAWMRGSGPIAGSTYQPAETKFYYSILDAVELAAPGDESRQKKLAEDVVAKTFDIIEDVFNRLAEEPVGGFDDEKESEMEEIAREFRAVDTKQELDVWIGRFVRAGIVDVLPNTRHKTRVTRDKFAARGFRSTMIINKAIEIENGKPRPADTPSKLKSAMNKAEKSVKDTVASAIDKSTPTKKPTGVKFNKSKEYMLVREPASGELSPMAMNIFDKWPMEDGEVFKAKDEIDRLNRFNFSQGKGEEFFAELLTKGLIEPADEQDPDQVSDPLDVDVADPRYAADDYARQHFGGTPGGMGGDSMSDY